MLSAVGTFPSLDFGTLYRKLVSFASSAADTYDEVLSSKILYSLPSWAVLTGQLTKANYQ